MIDPLEVAVHIAGDTAVTSVLLPACKIFADSQYNFNSQQNDSGYCDFIAKFPAVLEFNCDQGMNSTYC